MSREMGYATKHRLIRKLNSAFNWDIDADKITILTDRTSGAFRWSSLLLSPQIHSELVTADKIIKAKELSYHIDDDIGGSIDIADEPFQKSSFFVDFDKPSKVEFKYITI
jgi:hypothetical protein